MAIDSEFSHEKVVIFHSYVNVYQGVTHGDDWGSPMTKKEPPWLTHPNLQAT